MLPAEAVHEALVDAARRHIEVEMGGEDGDALSCRRENVCPRAFGRQAFEGRVDGGMMSDDELRPKLLRSFDGSRRKIERKERLFHVPPAVDEQPAVVVCAERFAVRPAQREGRDRVDKFIHLLRSHRE